MLVPLLVILTSCAEFQTLGIASAPTEAEKNRALDQAVTALGMKTLEVPQNNHTVANPPSKYVKGVVEQVDRESGLVLISIGTDGGVRTDHTLEAFRLRPQPEYLGMIRIVEANAHKAVGRLMRSSAFAQQPSLRVGDEVFSSMRRAD